MTFSKQKTIFSKTKVKEDIDKFTTGRLQNKIKKLGYGDSYIERIKRIDRATTIEDIIKIEISNFKYIE